jgi:hypothetical protein
MTTAERVTLAAAALDTGISRLNATAEFDGAYLMPPTPSFASDRRDR